MPALTRDQRARAIRAPVERAGGVIDAELVQRLLNDTNEDLDQLPVLQHAMMRCWQHATALAAPGATPHLRAQDYADIGCITGALDRHGEELLAELASLPAPPGAPALRTSRNAYSSA